MSRISLREYRALAEIRYRIRQFLNFSEAQARSVGLEPQQHQLLLAIQGLPPEIPPSIRAMAERLQIQHNSAVELVNRSVDRGLLQKRTAEKDRRQVLLVLTARGKGLLEQLALAHRTELRATAPLLLESLGELLAVESS